MKDTREAGWRVREVTADDGQEPRWRVRETTADDGQETRRPGREASAVGGHEAGGPVRERGLDSGQQAGGRTPRCAADAGAWWCVEPGKGHVFGYSGGQVFWLTAWGKRVNRYELRGLAGDICSGKSPRAVADGTDHAFVAVPFEEVTRIKASQIPGELEIFYRPLGLDEQHEVIRPSRQDSLAIATELAGRIDANCRPTQHKASLFWSIADPVGVFLMGGLLCVGLVAKALDVEAGEPYSGPRRSVPLGLLVWAATQLGSQGALVLWGIFAGFCLAWIVRRIVMRAMAIEFAFNGQRGSAAGTAAAASGQPAHAEVRADTPPP